MRYLKAVLVLALVLFIIFQLVYNYPALVTPVSLVLRLPRVLFGEVTFSLVSGLIFFFALGFLSAVSLEVYYWFGYTRTIRQQKKLIQALEKEVDRLRALTPAANGKSPPETPDA